MREINDMGYTKSSSQLAHQIKQHLAKHDKNLAGYTFDHIVLGDFNINRASIEFCLASMKSWVVNAIQELPDESTPPYYLSEVLRLSVDTYDLLVELWHYDDALLAEVSELLKREPQYND
jgi:hypothetical protein